MKRGYIFLHFQNLVCVKMEIFVLFIAPSPSLLSSFPPEQLSCALDVPEHKQVSLMGTH